MKLYNLSRFVLICGEHAKKEKQSVTNQKIYFRKGKNLFKMGQKSCNS